MSVNLPLKDYENMSWIEQYYWFGQFDKTNSEHHLLNDYILTWLSYVTGNRCVMCSQSTRDCLEFGCEDC